MQAMENFVGESGLTGTAYDSAKTYCQGMFFPSLRQRFYFEEELVKLAATCPAVMSVRWQKRVWIKMSWRVRLLLMIRTIDSQNQAP